MSVIHTTTVRNGIANYVTGEIDDNGRGKLVFETAADAEVATLLFSTTAFLPAGQTTAGVASADTIDEDNNCNAGVVTKFKVTTGNDDTIFSGSVVATGNVGDIVLSSTSIGQGDTISVSSLTYEAPN